VIPAFRREGGYQFPTKSGGGAGTGGSHGRNSSLRLLAAAGSTVLAGREQICGDDARAPRCRRGGVLPELPRGRGPPEAESTPDPCRKKVVWELGALPPPPGVPGPGAQGDLGGRGTRKTFDDLSGVYQLSANEMEGNSREESVYMAKLAEQAER